MNSPRILASFSVLLAAACSSAAPTGSVSSGQSSGSPYGSSSQGAAPGAPLSSNLAGNPGGGSCVPAAPTTFANAICVCDDLGEAGILHTHATAPGAASVGVNGRVAAATGSDIEGSLVAYGGLSVAGGLDVRDAVQSTGNVTGVGTLDVSGDLSVGGNFSFVGSLDVGGALRLEDPGTVLPAGQISQSAPYVAPAGPPCGCDPSALLPIASAVSAAASSNDNATIGLSTSGADLLGAGDLSLPTGKYYFKNVTRVGAGKITVTGTVAVYIDGSIEEVGANQIALAAGASLDLYVSGTIATAGSVALGDPTHPEAFRLFVGGAGSMMATAGDQTWNGMVYAPQAQVSFAGITSLNGSLFAKSLDWAGVLDVAYDGPSSATSCMPAPDAGTGSTSIQPTTDDGGASSSSPPPSSPSEPK